MVFLKYNNGSNLERSLLSIIQSFVANPSKMKIFLIRLLFVSSILAIGILILNQYFFKKLRGKNYSNACFI